MQKYYKIKKAFSLVEISVVILVIGILIQEFQLELIYIGTIKFHQLEIIP
jgi:prepilin-type N-terminal cleavage/methylation domain-containing protein